MNWGRGLFRVWLFLCLSWFLIVSAFIWIYYSLPTTFQYAAEMKVDNPTSESNLKKHIGELFARPSENKRPIQFAQLYSQYVPAWEKLVDQGELVKMEFLDGTALYLDNKNYLTKNDRAFLAKQFWETRYWRIAERVWIFTLWVAIPPILLLLIGLATRWVFVGFKR